ncbi:MAG: lipid-A-disaccharide synthase [Betaproteobacteria bacterium]|nr:lipid-A-disaccharide synthase [Betaproteobacteria bacterium]
MRRLVAVTGEASGDLIAADAMKTLRLLSPELELAGIGGPRLSAIGMECWFSSNDLAVRGYVEALSKLVHILAVRYWLLEYANKWQPRVFLGVDAPDFNLGVEARLRGRGVRTVHLISPSIWAWRPERIRKIQQAVDHMLCIFPFETDIYNGTGVQATYVGHPIADLIAESPDRKAARAALGVPDDARPVVAVMPGSRIGELQHNSEAFFGAAMALTARAHVVVPAASQAMTALLNRLSRRRPVIQAAREAGVRWIEQPLDSETPISHTVLAACDVALVASGTATLEAALFKRPMVIGYRVPNLTYRLMKRRAVISMIGLPNILLKEQVVPEFIQDQCNAKALEDSVLAWLDQPQKSAALIERFSGLHQSLRLGAAHRIADILASELDHAYRGR